MTTAAMRSPVADLADRFWEWFLQRAPVYATFLGDERYDDRLEDPGPAGRAEEVASLDAILADAGGIDPSQLDAEDRITLDMLAVVARIRLEQLEQRLWQFEAIDQMAGPQNLPGDLSRFQRTDTPERFERLLTRLRAFPAYLAAHRDNLADGVRERRTAAAPVIERTIAQVRRTVETPIDESPLMTANRHLTDEQRNALSAVLEEVVGPAFVDHLAALEAYAPHARQGVGICSLPDGDALYRTAIVASTTLDEDPATLHEFGLARLEAIDRERLAIARELGYADVPALRAALDGDPDNYATDGASLVERATRQVERASALAARFFGRLPRAACDVRAVEPYQEQEAPPAFYYPPAADGSRGGIYYINTYQPESRPLHRLATTTYHEAVPGHHFQLSIETELEGLHAFRRLGSRLVGMAYPEGWGLYSERLADEMGLFDDPRERFGMLDAQAWRAARLVVDTGLHAFGWERDRAVDVLRDIGLGRLEAETEADRYISWPGQALAYMTGQREIESLRRQLEHRDGERFDLRAFHDAVLGHGALPLATLRRELPGWMTPSDG
jgi:uncharacterized protein (DUF885 family)